MILLSFIVQNIALCDSQYFKLVYYILLKVGLEDVLNGAANWYYLVNDAISLVGICVYWY
jgi:hypothetical protein